jgi:hypothetical protein
MIRFLNILRSVHLCSDDILMLSGYHHMFLNGAQLGLSMMIPSLISIFPIQRLLTHQERIKRCANSAVMIMSLHLLKCVVSPYLLHHQDKSLFNLISVLILLFNLPEYSIWMLISAFT